MLNLKFFAPTSYIMKTFVKKDKKTLFSTLFLLTILTNIFSVQAVFASETIQTKTNCAQAYSSPGVFPADSACLPAIRWTNPVVETSGGLTPIGMLNTISAFITKMFLSIAQLIWNFILAVANVSDVSSPSNIVTKTIGGFANGSIAYVGSIIIVFSAIFWAVALWRSGKDFLRGRIGQAVKNLFIFAIIYAFIFVTSNASIEANKLGPEASVNYPLSLPWLAGRVSDFGNKLTSPIAKGLTTAANKNAKNMMSGSDDNFSCSKYVYALNDSYLNGQNSNGLLYSMSSMWYETQYKFWEGAQFGTPPRSSNNIPENTMCHWAELNNTIPAVEQQAFASAAYSAKAIKQPTSKILPVFQKDGVDYDMKKRAAVAWAVCTFSTSSNTWVTRSDWYGVGGKDPKTDYFGDSCTKVFTGQVDDMIIDKGKGFGVNVWKLKLGSVRLGRNDPFYIFSGDGYAGAFSSSSDTTYIQKTEGARAFTDALMGDNASDKIPNGFLALLIALVYLYTFLPLLLGGLIATILLYVLLIALPIVLALYASGFKKAGGVLKLTGTSMVSSIFLTLLISSVIFISEILRFGVANIPMGTLLRSLASGLCPVFAFLLIRRILKAFGMADILKPTGALSFVSSAAMVATGDKKISSFGKVDKETGKNGIQRGMTSAVSGAVNAGFKLAQLAGTAKKGAKMASFASKAKKQKKVYDKLSDTEKASGNAAGLFKEMHGYQKYKKAKKAQAQDTAASEFLKRKKNGETSRINKAFNWIDKKAVSVKDRNEDGSERDPSMFESLLLFATKNKDKTINTLDPKTQQALGYKVKDKPKPLAAQWREQIFSGEFDGTPTEFEAPSTLSPDVIKMKNDIANQRLAKENKGKSLSEVNANYDKLTSKTLSSFSTQFHPEGFEGITTQAGMAAAMVGASEMFGVSPNQVVVASDGSAMLRIMDMNRKDMKDLPAHAMRLPYMYYSPEFRKQRDGEDVDRWMARMTLQMRADNLMDDDGNLVDMLDMLGLSEDDVEAWQQGAKNAKLSNKVITPKNNNALKWNQAARRIVEKRQEQYAKLMDDAIFNSFSELEATVENIPMEQMNINVNKDKLVDALNNFNSVMNEYTEKKVTNTLTDEIEQARKDARKVLDEQKDTWLSLVANQQSNIIASDVLSDTLLRQEKNANEIVDTLVSELNNFTVNYEKIEEAIVRLYAGDLTTLEEVKNAISKSSEIQKEQAEIIKDKTERAVKAYKEANAQTEATIRRTNLNYQKKTKDLFESVLESFPEE